MFWFVFVLNFLIQRRPTRTLFYSNFQGFTYCSIFDFQGSLLLSVSAATRLVYQMLFCLSTTFLFIFLNFFEVRLSCFTRRVLTLSYLLVVVKQKFLFFYFRVKKIITWKWSGERGIWTLAPVARPTPLAGAPLRPLEYFSVVVISIWFVKNSICFRRIDNYIRYKYKCQPVFFIFFKNCLFCHFDASVNFCLNAIMHKICDFSGF